MKKRLIALILLLLLGVNLPASAQSAQYENRTVGAYDFRVGWRIEPAYVGIFNGPEFWVKDHAAGTPITGLETTLHLLTHLGDQEKLLQFYPIENDPGHYTADLIPTRPGDYTFHLFGTVNGQDVDEQFTSADGLFASVDPLADILFPPLDATGAATPESTDQVAPAATDDTASLQAQIDALKLQLQQLEGTQTP